jgi:SAM-dependent methyltransferase
VKDRTGMDAMAGATSAHLWGNADAYDAYMGRWSRPVAEAALASLRPSPGLSWLDVGCGTGAVTEATLDAADPREILGVDPPADFLATAARQITDPRVRFAVGDAAALPVPNDAYDVVIAGLVLHFVPDPRPTAREMARAATPDGTVAAYVWDFAGERQFQRYFWEAATALDPAAIPLAHSMQFALCHAEPLAALLGSAGLQDVAVQASERPAVFRDLDDYWQPYLAGGSSVAQRYAASLGDAQREALRERLQSILPMADDGSIRLLARAWAVRGTK